MADDAASSAAHPDERDAKKTKIAVIDDDETMDPTPREGMDRWDEGKAEYLLEKSLLDAQSTAQAAAATAAAACAEALVQASLQPLSTGVSSTAAQLTVSPVIPSLVHTSTLSLVVPGEHIM